MKHTPKRAIAIFVKTLGLSPLKTRLAAGIGEDRAMEFYTRALDCVQDLAQQSDAQPHWAIGEKEGLPHDRWQNFERLWTGEGDLGQRQHHIYSTLLQQYDQVMLIGTDCPQLTPADITAAFDALQTHDYAIAPAQDGGYTHLAGRKAVDIETWNSTQYSQSDTLEIF